MFNLLVHSTAPQAYVRYQKHKIKGNNVLHWREAMQWGSILFRERGFSNSHIYIFTPINSYFVHARAGIRVDVAGNEALCSAVVELTARPAPTYER